MRASHHQQQQNLGSFSSSFTTKKNNTTKQQGKMRNIGDGKKTIILRSAAKNDDANEIASEKDENTNTLTKREFGAKTFAFTSLSLFASSSSSQKEAFAKDDSSLNSNFWEK